MNWIVVGVMLAVIIAAGIFIALKISAAGLLRWYGIWALMLGFFIGMMILMFPNRGLHLHHYLIGIILTTFLCN